MQPQGGATRPGSAGSFNSLPLGAAYNNFLQPKSTTNVETGAISGSNTHVSLGVR